MAWYDGLWQYSAFECLNDYILPPFPDEDDFPGADYGIWNDTTSFPADLREDLVRNDSSADNPVGSWEEFSTDQITRDSVSRHDIFQSIHTSFCCSSDYEQWWHTCARGSPSTSSSFTAQDNTAPQIAATSATSPTTAWSESTPLDAPSTSLMHPEHALVDRMQPYGSLQADNTWKCAFAGCKSRATFSRPCDLRKHYNRHLKKFACRQPECSEVMFSTRKDRDRHESKHDPSIECSWEGCNRLFSRVDNMKDHVRRVHLRKLRSGTASAG